MASPQHSPSPLASPSDPTQDLPRHRQPSASSTSAGSFSPAPSPPLQPPAMTPSAVPQAPITHPDVQSLLEQTRLLLDQQRHVFHQERANFDGERKLWDDERRQLKARILELEIALAPTARKTARPGIGKSTMENSGRFGPPRLVPASNGARASGRSSRGASGEKFWEGSSSRQGSASRTFSDADDARLPSISERAPPPRPPASTAPPRADPTDANRLVSGGIDVSVIRQDLDGISLKPSALPPAVVAKVQSPSPLRSPEAVPEAAAGPTGGLSAVSSADDIYIKDAGHTPNAPRRMSKAESEAGSTPTQAQHTCRPDVAAEDAAICPEDYDDPPLKGPLSLPADGAEDDSRFLSELDARLLREARKVVHASPSSGSPSEASVAESAGEGDEGEQRERSSPSPIRQPEPEIRLKLKSSMNFGSAFGVGVVGHAQG
ncbi:MAG: hypothetical protein M1832_001444 [Thelocarpon impressellum]|nr:MAG: hypothetical protein M1832_001444 [Thelocarpon impressellum]